MSRIVTVMQILVYCVYTEEQGLKCQLLHKDFIFKGINLN
jgi:hypothetical protein